MTTYAWRGVDAAGRPARGRREGLSEAQVRDDLLAGGVTPTAITASTAPFAPARTGLSVNDAQGAAFAADLARFLKSGLSLGQTLHIIETTSEVPVLARLASHVRGELMAGRPLSAGLSAIPGQTGRYLQALAKAGEATGRLTEILAGGAAALKASAATRTRLITMIIYPLFVMAMAAAAILLFAFAVLPALEPAFTGLGGELPATTKAVMAGGRFLRLAAPILGLAGLVLALALTLSRAARDGALRGLHRLMLTRAGFGILPDTVFGGLAQRLSIAVGAGVPLATAYRVSVEAIGVEPVRLALEAQEPRLREGTKLSEVFRAIDFAPPMLVGLTKVGESASDLPRVLGEAGDALSARAQEKTERFLSILTPAIVLLIGLVVGGIVLVVFQGLMSISDMVEL
ncbi:type II secretion system F family protein [Caulobacter sp. NIBR1757]|uniref:type II secretion system F family protein n=1 Tax=Caulobacter sp. NIBR1757 TaxID=3016000 RepID=UPI0022F07730|nr:type II secretion system F family protein [Caulobacter sp. NIBR1757]WGM40229.1 Type II secretion system protein F [Caulobacter sp. NIBR1757]